MFQTWFQPPTSTHWYWGCSIWMGEGFQYAIMPNWWLRVRLILLGEVPRSGTFSEPTSEVNRDVNALTRMCHGAFWIIFRSRRPWSFHVFSIPIYPPKRIEQYNLPRFQPDFSSFWLKKIFKHGPTNRWSPLITTRLIVFFVPALVGV